MARRKKVYPTKIYQDPKFDSQVVGRLISKVMKDGKRSLAERIVYAAMIALTKAVKMSTLLKS